MREAAGLAVQRFVSSQWQGYPVGDVERGTPFLSAVTRVLAIKANQLAMLPILIQFTKLTSQMRSLYLSNLLHSFVLYTMPRACDDAPAASADQQEGLGPRRAKADALNNAGQYSSTASS